jgi:hypothetical protein
MTILRSFQNASAPIASEGAPPPPTNTLYIQYVGTGGNAHGGAYQYSFEKPSMIVNRGTSTSDTLTFTIQNASTTDKRTYSFYSYSSTSPGQVTTKTLAPATTVIFDVGLSANQLALLSIVVQDTSASETTLICCDPQLGNDPKTTS